jgi:hypothetical protein
MPVSRDTGIFVEWARFIPDKESDERAEENLA